MTGAMMARVKQPFFYFTALTVRNVRSFADEQELILTNEHGNPARWTLIVGDNGVGKTTLLQCVGRMRPVLGAGEDVVEPAVAQEENDAIDALARSARDVDCYMGASLAAGAKLDGGSAERGSLSTSMSFSRVDGRLSVIDPSSKKVKKFKEPLVLGYGAGRHMGFSNVEEVNSTHPMASLFDANVELFDAAEILYQLDYARLKKRPGAKKRLDGLKMALATILPDVSNPKDIQIDGPPTPGTPEGRTGVSVRTPYGQVSLPKLSFGYQTVTAWTVDIAWRMFQHYPDSPNPLAEPAIVLVDEIDLHLHPRWQRQIRRDLTQFFPNVQFIATAHSPLMAQTYLDANLAVVRREGDHAVIINDPVVTRDWRLDQVITSDLFGFESARPPDLDEKFARRLNLLRRASLTTAEKRELSKLDKELDSLPTAESHEDQKAMDIVRRAAELLKGTSRAP